MKSTGLLQLDDNLQQAGKVHNLQHVCGVSGCVMPNNIVLTTFNIFVLSVLLSLVPTASNSIVYPSSPNNIVTTILSRHDKTTMPNNIVLTTFNIVVLSVLLSPCSNNVEQHCSSIKSEQYCSTMLCQQYCSNMITTLFRCCSTIMRQQPVQFLAV